MNKVYFLSLSDDTNGWKLILECSLGKLTKGQVKHKVYKTLEMIYGSHETMEAFCSVCDDLVDAEIDGVISKSFPLRTIWSFQCENV